MTDGNATPNPIGDRIRTRRKARGLSLDKLAVAAGCSKSYLWSLEHENPPRPSAAKLSQIAAALGTTVDYLISDASEDAEDLAVYYRYRSLPEDTKARIRQLIEVWSR
jgi:transcriptional regulator with XRE-family HTH domain